MELNLNTRFTTKQGECLCFKHAVLAVMLADEIIQIEVDDFSSEYDMRRTSCVVCYQQTQDKALKDLLYVRKP